MRGKAPVKFLPTMKEDEGSDFPAPLAALDTRQRARCTRDFQISKDKPYSNDIHGISSH